METSNCKFCDTEFKLKRSDHRFCSNKCRSRFNNKNRLQNKSIVKEINKELLNDYKILNSILGDSSDTYVLISQLQIMGFSGKRFTNLEKLEGIIEQALGLYDIVFYQYDSSYFKLIKK